MSKEGQFNGRRMAAEDVGGTKNVLARVQQSLAFFYCTLLFCANQAHGLSSPNARNGGAFRHQRMCFQCQMPIQCSSGFCFGDFCVKSLVADKYVSKGCENRTTALLATLHHSQALEANKAHGPLYARNVETDAPTMAVRGQAGAGGAGQQVPGYGIGVAPGCVKMRVFGVENIICYCDDADYCNSARRVSVKLSQVWLVAVATAVTTFLPKWRR